MLIDTHCHLDFKGFDEDRDEVIKRARDAGVEKIINVGCDLEQSKNSIALAEKYDFIFASVGLHPQEANNVDDKTFSELGKLSEHPKAVAIGECGLEYSGPAGRDLNKEKQKEVFLRQLELSGKIQKPLIIHCRSAYDDLIEILNSSAKGGSASGGKSSILNSPPGVIHFFSGNLEQAKQLLDLGFFISFTGLITFVKDYDKIIQFIPLDKILIETDAPFVAPVPYRGKRNEPAYIVETAKKIAEIKNMSFNEVVEQTSKNALNLFSLK